MTSEEILKRLDEIEAEIERIAAARLLVITAYIHLVENEVPFLVSTIRNLLKLADDPPIDKSDS